ncbi:DUF3052 family protein, partial [Streptobacillus moniliformis]|uniref:DUF3052 family protein n=1 Tax=Streptobacillus moniliformis TaxID=34105 RepID=UPI001E494ED9
MSATAGSGSTQQHGTAPANDADNLPGNPIATRLGLTAGMVVQELGWDNDTDDDVRVAIEDTIDADMVDGDYG